MPAPGIGRVRLGGRRRPSFAIVTPRLLVGEYPTPEDAAWLRRTHGVRAVLCLQEEVDLANRGLDAAALRRAYAEVDIEFHHQPLPDGDGAALRARLDPTVTLLARLIGGGKRVYVHCTAGMNRAPTIAIAYLHSAERLTLDDAHELLRRRRPCVPYMRALRDHFRAPR